MDTTEVAGRLGTTPRILRQFLRSPSSTFVAVGSGARYEFTERDLPTLTKRFAEWNANGKPKPEGTKPKPARVKDRDPEAARLERDAKVWAEEGPVVLQDIRNPTVRARIKADARAAEDRLMLRLMAVGLHITQLGDRCA